MKHALGILLTLLALPLAAQTPVRAFATGTGEQVALATWLEYEPHVRTLRAARITPWGEVLDERGLIVAQWPAQRFIGLPAVAYGDGEFLLAWYTSDAEQYARRPDNIWFRRLGENGTFVDPDPVLLGAASAMDDVWNTMPALARNGEEFFVVWERAALPPGNEAAEGLYGTRVGAEQIRPAVQLTHTGRTGGVFTAERSPNLAWDGAQYLLTWTRTVPGARSLFALRLDRVTNPIGEPVQVPGIEVHRDNETRLLAAISPGRFVLAWRERTSFRSSAPIRTAGLHASSAGIALEGVQVAFNADANPLALFPRDGYAELFWNQASPVASGVGFTRIGPDGTAWLPLLGVGLAHDVILTPSGETLKLQFTPADPSRPYTSVVTASVPDTHVLPPPPATPENVHGVREGTFARISWDSVPGALGYRIERMGSWREFPDHATSTEFRTSADAGERFRVIAINTGGESAPSAWTSPDFPSRRRLVGR